MATLLALLALTLQDERLRIDGSPFLVQGGSVELCAVSSVRDAVVVWRLADGPASAIETQPALDSSTRLLRGAERLAVKSVGKGEEELLFAVTLERKGVRLAKEEFRLRIGPLLRVKAWVRIVENPLGGTRKPDRLSDPERSKDLEASVNRLLRPLGVEILFEAGRPVAAPDAWFDREGVFHPIGLKDGKKANSSTLNELLRSGEPGGLNVYFVRQCQWVTVQEGFPRIVTDHHLIGIGLKDGAAVLDDAWDAPSLAHELGHTLGLEDLEQNSERGRLMYSVRRDRTGQAFTYTEMKDAREQARRHLKSWLAKR
jgi:hypothetical protein